MFEWLKFAKAITKDGRKELAREILTENLTQETITRWAAQGANVLLDKISNKEKLDTIAATTARASTLVTTLSNAVKDGRISTEEAAEVRACIYDLIGTALTQEQLAALIDRVVAKIP